MARSRTQKGKKHPLRAEHLYQTEFLRVALLLGKRAIDQAVQRNKSGVRPPPMTSGEAYLVNVFHYTGALDRALQRADHAIGFLKTFPASRGLRARRISRSDWLAYRYSMFCVALTSTYDCALILTSTVFSLGLEPRSCRNDTVRDNWRLIGTGVRALLRKLEQALSKLKPVRNKMVHQADKPSFGESMELHLAAEFIEDTALDLGVDHEEAGPAVLRKPVRDYLVRAETRDLVAKLTDELDAVGAVSARLLGALEQPYLRQAEAFGFARPVTPSSD